MLTHRPATRNRGNPAPTVAMAVALAVCLGLSARHRFCFVTVVDSESMTPTLAPAQHVLTRRIVPSRPLRRGDIVVAESDEIGRTVVKRVIGLPGEHVVIGNAGDVVVDKQPLTEPYVVHTGGPRGTFDVPADHVLLLGDNRTRSHDSRSWQQPYLPVAAVRGRVWRRSETSPGGKWLSRNPTTRRFHSSGAVSRP